MGVEDRATIARTPDRPLARVAAPLRQEVIARLREAILSFDYEPGTRLIERVLCERFDVSRTVVREALRHLEADGLVTMVPNRGPIVSTLGPAEAIELYEVRAALESLAATLFASRASAEEREALQASVDAVESAYASDEIADWLRAKDKFYEALFAGAHNDVIRTTVLGLHARVQLLRRLSLRTDGRRKESLSELRQIAAAASAGHAKEAGALTKRHVESASQAAMEQLDSGTGKETRLAAAEV